MPNEEARRVKHRPGLDLVIARGVRQFLRGSCGTRLRLGGSLSPDVPFGFAAAFAGLAFLAFGLRGAGRPLIAINAVRPNTVVNYSTFRPWGR